MPEGPSVRRWGDIAQQFIHKRIKKVKGVSKVMENDRWRSACINDVIVYGKQMFFQLLKIGASENDAKAVNEKDTSARIESIQACDNDEKNVNDKEDSIWYRYHFLMWGSLRANEYKGPSKRSKRAKKSESPKPPNPMVEFHFEDKTFLVFYGGSIRIVDGPCEDEGTDILSDTFDVDKAVTALLKPIPLCYTIMDQTHFAGAGNIVKNEVLYACRMHPLELGSNLTRVEALQLAEEVVRFTKNWHKWEEESSGYQKFGSQMKMYWKYKCPDGHKTMRGYFGDQLKRMTTWCPECQELRVESDISKGELEDIGKFKKTTLVKRQNEDESDDDNGNMKSQKKKKVKPKKGTSDAVKMSGQKSATMKYEDDDDVEEEIHTSMSKKVGDFKGRKKNKSIPSRKRKTEKRSVETGSEISQVALKNQPRKRTHSDISRAEQNEKAKYTNVKQKYHHDVDDDVKNEKGTFVKRSLRSRVKVENQEIESDKSTKAEIPHKLSHTMKEGNIIEETNVHVPKKKKKISNGCDEPDDVSIVTVGTRGGITEEPNYASEGVIDEEHIDEKSTVIEEKIISVRRSARLKKE